MGVLFFSFREVKSVSNQFFKESNKHELFPVLFSQIPGRSCHYWKPVTDPSPPLQALPLPAYLWNKIWKPNHHFPLCRFVKILIIFPLVVLCNCVSRERNWVSYLVMGPETFFKKETKKEEKTGRLLFGPWAILKTDPWTQVPGGSDTHLWRCIFLPESHAPESHGDLSPNALASCPGMLGWAGGGGCGVCGGREWRYLSYMQLCSLLLIPAPPKVQIGLVQWATF